MKYYKAAIIASILFMIFSCSKENEEMTSTTVIKKNPFYPLNEGNYWVYEFRSHFPDGTVSDKMKIDTLKVTGEKLIEERLYWVLETDQPFKDAIWYLRDSSGYIINHLGSMFLPPMPTANVYNDHFGFIDQQNKVDTTYHYYVQFPDETVKSTLFGNLNCLEQHATHISYLKNPRAMIVDSSYYSELGPVQRSYAYLSGSKVVGKLIEYHLED